MNVNISATAIKNHEELWPNYQSIAAQTNPELIEIFRQLGRLTR